MYRRAYVGELHIRTQRNSFNSIAPTAHDFFSELSSKHKSNLVPSLQYEGRTLELKQISQGNNSWNLLFVLVDPTAPDPSLRDRSNSAIRDQRRSSTEDPIFSCHMSVDSDPARDTQKQYPVAIENRALISKTSIINLLNTFAKVCMAKQELHTGASGKVSTKDYIPRVLMVAPINHTIAGSLNGGGILRGVEIVYEKAISQTHGDSTFPVLESRDIKMIVKNRPTGERAKDIAKGIIESVKSQDPKKIKVLIDDSSGHPKTVSIDDLKDDYMTRAFIHQVTLHGITQPDVHCESTINQKVASALIGAARAG